MVFTFFLFYSPFFKFTLGFNLHSLQQGIIPQSNITEILIQPYKAQHGHMLRCLSQLTNGEMCVSCIFYSIQRLRTRIMLTFNSWFLIILAALTCTPHLYCCLPALFFAEQVYITTWVTALYSTLFCRVGGSTLQVINLLVRERWITHWSATLKHC